MYGVGEIAILGAPLLKRIHWVLGKASWPEHLDLDTEFEMFKAMAQDYQIHFLSVFIEDAASIEKYFPSLIPP